MRVAGRIQGAAAGRGKVGAGEICRVAMRPERLHVRRESNPPIMADKTLFEKIRDREIPADIVHQDERCTAFRDISPQAPVHILVVPNQAITRVGLAGADDESVLGHLLLTAAEIARSEGIDATGYRLVINNGQDAGEAVPHLHVHLLGGRKLDWPPG